MSEYEKAAGWPALEYGAPCAITVVEDKTIAPSLGVLAKQYIDGYAIRWRSLIAHGDNKFAYFLPDSIKNPMLGERKRLLLDHDDEQEVCDTSSGLILHPDEHGLAIRVSPPDTWIGRKALETVRNGDRTALSLGVIMHGDEYAECEGVKVKIVRSAILQEVSIVRSGACRPAFCQLVDAADCRSLVEESRSLKLLSDGAFQNMIKAARILSRELGERR